MSPLLQFMLTPQAAPESDGLRACRFAVLWLCAQTLGLVTWLQVGAGTWRDVIGAMACASVLITAIVALVYGRWKTSADEAYATRMVAGEGEP